MIEQSYPHDFPTRERFREWLLAQQPHTLVGWSDTESCALARCASALNPQWRQGAIVCPSIAKRWDSVDRRLSPGAWRAACRTYYLPDWADKFARAFDSCFVRGGRIGVTREQALAILRRIK